MTKRTWNSKKQLEDLGLSLKVLENGEYEFYYKGVKKQLYMLKCKHKYGKTISYPSIAVYIGTKVITKTGREYYKQAFILAHVFVWLWFNNFIQKGMDIDHIDDNKMNYNIDNLQELTRKDNISKRGYGRNQYSANLSNEEILKLRAEKQAKKNAIAHRKQLAAQKKIIINRYKKTISGINAQINELNNQLNTCTYAEYKLNKQLIKNLKQQKAVARWYYKEELYSLKAC